LLKTELPAKNGKVYFNGDGGFKYYMSKEGLPLLYADSNGEWFLNGDPISAASLGDYFFVAPTTAFLWARKHFNACLTQKYGLYLLDQIDYEGTVALLNTRTHTGFYCSNRGLMPFYLSFKKIPIESFKIYRVVNSN
jgi:hypothetical protein